MNARADADGGSAGSSSATATLIAHREVNGARWEEILDATAAEFSKVGFKAARLQDIARRLGLTARSLYHYVASKEELLYELVADTHRRGVAGVLDLEDKQETPEERLRTFVTGWGALAQAMRYSVAERDLLFLTPEHREAVTDQRRVVHGVARKIIEDGMRDGAFDRSLDAAVVANSLFSMLGSSRQWYRSDGSMPLGDLFEWYAELFIRGLAPTPPSEPA